MALVAYANSDSSDYEDDENDSTPVVKLIKKAEESTVQVQNSTLQNGDHDPNTNQSLFNRLPQPANQKGNVIEEDDEFLHKKETPTDCVKPKSKITVPSLSDFQDVKETVPTTKPKFINGKKSGLLSMLPQPKNSVTTSTTKSLIPHVLTKKPQSSVKKTPIPTPSKTKPQDSKSSNLINDYSDDSDNDDVQNDFFSIHKTVVLPAEEVDLNLEHSSTPNVEEPTSSKQARTMESYFKKDIDENMSDGASHADSSNDIYNSETAPHASGHATSNGTGEIAIDEETIFKLCGSRSKRKREDIQIVDVNQQEVLADAREWLIKGLMDDTSKRVSASKKRGNEPTSQQKRKHQITYLAHQAKANEIELQNQWANNRITKRQTQSKYGF